MLNNSNSSKNNTIKRLYRNLPKTKKLKIKRNFTKSKSKSKNIKTVKNSNRVYTKKDFQSADGMLTSVWGPSLWHYLHTMSFNYPVNPTNAQKKQYRSFILNLQHVLPCKWCRLNLRNNLKKLPLTMDAMKNRDTFSRYVFNLHEHINTMLGKKSGLKYCDVRERYEHFRSRCTLDINMKPEQLHSLINHSSSHASKTSKKEKGCTEPLYGKKSKCIIKIVPLDQKGDTFQIDDKCIKSK